MRGAMLAAAILACALGLSACGGSSGFGSPKTSGGTGGSGGSSKTGTPLAGTDPCTLLKPGDLPELVDDDYIKPEASGGEHPFCGGYDFGVAIIDNDQLAHEMDFEDSRAQPVPDIAGHHAVAARIQVGSAKSCSVSMEVTTDEYVRIGIMHDEDPSKTCDIAIRAAAVVASRIPA